MGLGPIKAVNEAVQKAKWNLKDVDLFEIIRRNYCKNRKPTWGKRNWKKYNS